MLCIKMLVSKDVSVWLTEMKRSRMKRANQPLRPALFPAEILWSPEVDGLSCKKQLTNYKSFLVKVFAPSSTSLFYLQSTACAQKKLSLYVGTFECNNTLLKSVYPSLKWKNIGGGRTCWLNEEDITVKCEVCLNFKLRHK